jgi:hypothetical protein
MRLKEPEDFLIFINKLSGYCYVLHDESKTTTWRNGQVHVFVVEDVRSIAQTAQLYIDTPAVSL